jgi:hypothetical protein
LIAAVAAAFEIFARVQFKERVASAKFLFSLPERTHRVAPRACTHNLAGKNVRHETRPHNELIVVVVVGNQGFRLIGT